MTARPARPLAVLVVAAVAATARGMVLVDVASFSTPRTGVLRIRTLNARTVRIEGLGAD